MKNLPRRHSLRRSVHKRTRGDELRTRLKPGKSRCVLGTVLYTSGRLVKKSEAGGTLRSQLNYSLRPTSPLSLRRNFAWTYTTANAEQKSHTQQVDVYVVSGVNSLTLFPAVISPGGCHDQKGGFKENARGG